MNKVLNGEEALEFVRGIEVRFQLRRLNLKRSKNKKLSMHPQAPARERAWMHAKHHSLSPCH